MTGREISQGNSGIVAADARPSAVQLRRSNFRKSAEGREVVIVLGMHRSGTSLLANVLHLLGVDMLDQPPHTSAKNQTGFWERQDIVALHDEILSTLNVPVGSPAHAIPFAPGWWRSLEIKPQKKKLRDLMAEHLSHVRRPWGFKDPRTCRLLPLWGEILEELDVSPRFVWAVRHPAESSLSMSQKNPVLRPLTVAQSEVMWLAYNYDILRYVGRHWPIIVPYDAWFDDPMALAVELGRELDLIWQGSDHELETALAALIHREHRHHWVKDHKLRCSISLSEDLYRSILRIRAEPDAETGEEALQPLQSLFGAVQPFATEAREVKPLREENQRLANDIEELKTRLEGTGTQVTELQVLLATSEAEISAHTDELLATRGQLAELQSGSESEIVRLKAGHDETTALLESERSRAFTIAGELSAVTAERDLLNGNLQKASRKLDSFRNQLSAAGTAQDALHGSLKAAAAESQQLQAELGHAAAREEKLQSELSSATEQRAALLSRHDALKSDHAAAVKKLDAFRGLLASATAAQEVLKASVLQASDERDAARSGLAAESAAHDDLQKEHSLAIRKLESYRTQLAEVCSDRDALQAELNRLSGERDTLDADLQSATSAFAALQSDQTELATRRDELVGELSAATATLQSLEKEHSGLSDEHHTLLAKLAASTALHDALSTEHLALTAERDQLRSGLDATTHAEVSLRSEYTMLAESTELLRAELHAAKTAAAAQADANAMLRRDHEQLKIDAATLRRTLRDEREWHAETLHGLPGDKPKARTAQADQGARHPGQARPA